MAEQTNYIPIGYFPDSAKPYIANIMGVGYMFKTATEAVELIDSWLNISHHAFSLYPHEEELYLFFKAMAKEEA